uniref:Uncharacterized protein n=1 Tax=uncultured marine virus TaxID=186617 RepID=A0A0F7L8P2_9VIRU|nr:hypothetical protein [uncultured marine virus]
MERCSLTGRRSQTTEVSSLDVFPLHAPRAKGPSPIEPGQVGNAPQDRIRSTAEIIEGLGINSGDPVFAPVRAP